MQLKDALELFRGKCGLEVGGPSRIFLTDGMIPIYPIIEELDGCNFSKETLWESGLEEGQTYKYGDNIGYQFICEAANLEEKILPNQYDFIISSNCLEHSANPLKVLIRFIMAVKSGGLILLVLPKKEVTFDHKRKVTTYTHLYEDYKNNMGEDDLTHLPEILELHDLSLDLPAGTLEQFKERSLKNHENRGLHQHVFDLPLLLTILKAFNLEKVYAGDIVSDYIIVGRKQ